MRGDRDHAVPLEEQVREAARDEARAEAAADHLDVPLDARVESEHLRGVEGEGFSFELDEEDLRAILSEEDFAVAGGAHHVGALAGGQLLDELHAAARALVLELHLALVGDHGAGGGDDFGCAGIEAAAQHSLGLKGPAVVGLDFLVFG